jgi:DNA modification methylase
VYLYPHEVGRATLRPALEQGEQIVNIKVVSEPSSVLAGATSRRDEMMAVAELTPSKANPRTHSKKQIRQIAESIERFGFTNPVLIDDGGGIIAGHGRVAAAKLLGMVDVPVRRLSHLSPADRRAYIIADNRLAELAGWDPEILASELQALIELDFEVELTGFETGEIDIILGDADEARREAAGPEDDIPAPALGSTICQSGDLWRLGGHSVTCGDACQSTTYELLLGDEKATQVIADAPYNVPINGHVCGKGSIQHREFAMASGEMDADEFSSFLKGVFQQLVANTIDGAIHHIFMDWRHMTEMLTAGTVTYAELKNLCIWNKTNAGMGSFYRSQHELVFIWKSGSAPHRNNFGLGQHGRHRTNVWTYPGVTSMGATRLEELAMHPTVKPVALIADAIRDCSARGDTILDPFLGSGTTLIACERTGRRARGIEIDPVYCDVAIKRWQRYTGKAAILAKTGESFEEIKERLGNTSPAEMQEATK